MDFQKSSCIEMILVNDRCKIADILIKLAKKSVIVIFHLI